MIQTKQDLKFYLQEDAKRNDINKSYFVYLIKLFIKRENVLVFRYLKSLRHCEYHFNNSRNLYHKFMYYLFRVKTDRLGSKYHIYIPLNTAGYGLRIMHISGGGRNIAKCKEDR